MNDNVRAKSYPQSHLATLPGFMSLHFGHCSIVLQPQGSAEREGADAANSLGIIYETGKDVEVDKDAAAEWYYRAGQLFLKARRLEDTEMALVGLNGLTPDHPLGIKLRALMEARGKVLAKPSTTSS